MRMLGLVIGLAELLDGGACKSTSTQPAPSIEPAKPAPAITSDAATPVTLPAGARFERKFSGPKLETGEHDVMLDNLLLESTGAEAVSLSFGVIEHGYRNGSATLGDHFEVVDAGGHVTPVVVQTVELDPRNGGGAIHSHDGTYLIPMKDSTFAGIRLVFASNLTPAVVAVRIPLDRKPLDIPLPFGPPTVVDVPPPPPTSMIACDKLAKCCAAQRSVESQAACTDLVAGARSLAMPEECENAARSYCQ